MATRELIDNEFRTGLVNFKKITKQKTPFNMSNILKDIKKDNAYYAYTNEYIIYKGDIMESAINLNGIVIQFGDCNYYLEDYEFHYIFPLTKIEYKNKIARFLLGVYKEITQNNHLYLKHLHLSKLPILDWATEEGKTIKKKQHKLTKVMLKYYLRHHNLSISNFDKAPITKLLPIVYKKFPQLTENDIIDFYNIKQYEDFEEEYKRFIKNQEKISLMRKQDCDDYILIKNKLIKTYISLNIKRKLKIINTV
jgi:hypothetical protein